MRRSRLRSATTLAAVAAVSLAAALAAASCADTTTVSGEMCAEGQTACGERCVNLLADPGHCGACGAACGLDQACEAGACVMECSDATTHCAGACVDLKTDPTNCGGCNVACPDGVLCAEGLCTAACPAGEIRCGGYCTDTQTDPEHCGACGDACPSGQPCENAECQACSSGLTECDGQCVDTQTDLQHCGGCGVACPVAHTCVAGDCESACDAPGPCGLCIVDIGSATPQTLGGSTIGADDGYSPACGAAGSPEAAYSFTAPADASYTFSTGGSDYDTVLAILAPSCGELGCNDDFNGFTSQVQLTLAAGDTVYIVVDGLNGAGTFELHVSGGGMGGVCDNSGECGDSTFGCIACALEGSCADELTICQNDVDCIDFAYCLDGCGDQACVDDCTLTYPGGAALYDALVDCVICQECYNDCDGAGQGC